MMLSLILPLLLTNAASSSSTPSHHPAQQLKRIHCLQYPNSPGCFSAESAYVDAICQPITPKGDVDLSALCNIFAILGGECELGVAFNASEARNPYFAPGRGWHYSQRSEKQRLCLCESQFWDAWRGRQACKRSHGGPANWDGAMPDEIVSSMNSAYCAAAATPTVGFWKFVNKWEVGEPAFSSFESEADKQAKTSVFSDPIGSQTAVSLYYTPRVTGFAALDVAALTRGASATHTDVWHGQVVATMSTIDLRRVEDRRHPRPKHRRWRRQRNQGVRVPAQ